MKTDRVGLTRSISSTTKPETQRAAVNERSAVRKSLLFWFIVIVWVAKIKTSYVFSVAVTKRAVVSILLVQCLSCSCIPFLVLAFCFWQGIELLTQFYFIHLKLFQIGISKTISELDRFN